MYEENNGMNNTGGQSYQSGSQNYNQSSNASSTSNTSTTGNGSYQYGNGSQYNYSSGYGSNQTGSNYSGNGTGTAGNGGAGGQGGKHGGGKKAIFAVVLAAVFGICVGSGVVTASHFLKSSNAAESTEKASSQATLQEAGTQEGDSSQAQSSDSSSASASDSGTTDLTQGAGKTVVTDVTEVAENVMPSIVSVYNSFTQSANYFGQTYSQESTSTGSGIIVGKTDTELLIATNNHVVDDADSLKVQFVDNTTAEAQLKGTDASNDLAVIAVSLEDLTDDTLGQIKVATLGDSDTLKVGEPAIAIGNALGYGQSVTTGVVSAINREITTENGTTNTYIQTDAAINPGNSGGALVDINGEVIGINSNKIGGTSVEGMGYAIPISKAKPIIENLMNQETKTKVDSDKQGYLGISGVSVTAQVSSAYNMPQGVYVAKLVDNGPADNSDLKEGDIITGINGSTITSMDELKSQLTYYEAGTEVTLTVKRANSENGYDEYEVKVTLGSQEVINNDSQSQQYGQGGYSEQGSSNPFGGLFGN